MDDTDFHETETALRETEEEIGLSSEHINVSYGRLSRAMNSHELELFLDLGCRLADHPARWTFDCANYRRDPQLHSRDAQTKPRRSVQNFHNFAGSTSRPALLPSHSVQDSWHLRIFDASVSRRREKVLGNDSHHHSLSAVLVTAQRPLQPAIAFRNQIRNDLIAVS